MRVLPATCALSLLALAAAQPRLGLRVSPERAVRWPARSPLAVTCEGFGAEPNLFAQMRWEDPRGHVLDARHPNPDVRAEPLAPGRLVLHFAAPSAEESGAYRCLATFQHSDSFEATVNVTFFQDVTWDDCPALQALVLGRENERVRCKASANPKPSIQWTKDDRPLDRTRYQIDAEGVAISGAVAEQDGGVFRVRALVTETGRLHDAFITVQVLRAPQVDVPPERLEAVEEQQAVLQCVARGHPEPLVTWLDPHMRNLSAVGGYAVDARAGQLVIARARLDDDSGRFTCVAQNAAGSARQQIQLVVIRAPKVSLFANISADEGHEAALECRAHGIPLPALQIRRDGDSRALQTGDARVTLEQRHEAQETVLRVRINPTSRADDGLYFCRAENRGAAVEATGHLQVRFAPDMRRTPTTAVKHWSLRPLNVTCVADAIPNATVRWFFRGLELQPDGRALSIEDDGRGLSRLHVDPRLAQRDIYGQYRCLALNSLGANEVRIQVDQAFRPGVVLQATADRIQATSVLFRVLAPSFDGGMPLKAMHAQLRPEDSAEWSARKWPLSARDEYLVDGLRARTRYLVRFAAENEVGVADWSVERAFWTEREGRPERPLFRNVEREPNTQEALSPLPDQIHVAWTLPEDNGRPVRFFELRIQPVRRTETGVEPVEGAREELATVDMTSEAMTSFAFRHLAPETLYRVRLRANNELGFGPESELVFRTAAGHVTAEPLPDERGGPQVALVAGLALAAVLVLLLAVDLVFCARCHVGALHVLSRRVFRRGRPLVVVGRARATGGQ